MPNDPGLAADTCIFMEAVSGDGGAHNTANPWWLSPDINLTGPVSGIDRADAGQDNSVDVRMHRKTANSGCTTIFSESVTIELWVANPSLAMVPNSPASTANVFNIGTPMLAEGATATQPIVWNPPAGLDPTDPQSAGHKCLIARCYPDALVPDPDSFHTPDDPHVAQHNICIVPFEGPSQLPLHRRECAFKISTINPSRTQAQNVTLTAAVDLNPNKFVKKVVQERLERIRRFKRLATRAPRRFRFLLPDFPNAQITSDARSTLIPAIFGGGSQRNLSAKVSLNEGQFTTFTFVVDMSNANGGDAYIFHLRQVGSRGRDQGGLTVVMIAV